MPSIETNITVYDFSDDFDTESLIWAVEDDGNILQYECMVRYETWAGECEDEDEDEDEDGAVRRVCRDEFEIVSERLDQYPDGDWDNLDVDYKVGHLDEEKINSSDVLVVTQEGKVLSESRSKKKFSDYLKSLDVIFGGKELTQVVDLYGDPLPSKDSPLREDIVKLAKAEGKEFDRMISEYRKRLGKAKVDRG